MARGLDAQSEAQHLAFTLTSFTMDSFRSSSDFFGSAGLEYRPTPPLSKSRQPSPGELLTYQTGAENFPELAGRGSFRLWDDLNAGVPVTQGDFNSFAWSLGHTDRWIQGGSLQDMKDLCETAQTPAAGPRSCLP